MKNELSKEVDRKTIIAFEFLLGFSCEVTTKELVALLFEDGNPRATKQTAYNINKKVVIQVRRESSTRVVDMSSNLTLDANGRVLDGVRSFVPRYDLCRGFCDHCGRKNRPTIIVHSIHEDPREPGAAVTIFQSLGDTIRGKYCIWMRSTVNPIEREIAEKFGMTRNKGYDFSWCVE